MASSWVDGFLRDDSTLELVTTTDATGADWVDGFLRSPAGALVVSSGPGEMSNGFVRATGALVVDSVNSDGVYRNGFIRGSDGALQVVTGGSYTWKNGFMRTAGGLLGTVAV